VLPQESVHFSGNKDYKLSSITNGMAGKFDFVPLLLFDPPCERSLLCKSAMENWFKNY